MANIKFSQFTSQSDYNNVDALVGYNGATNVRITPSDVISSWNGEQALIRFSNNTTGNTSLVDIGSATNTDTDLNLTSGGTAGFSINGLNAVSYNGVGWGIADNNIEVEVMALRPLFNYLVIV
jgi:hypothetical protein